MWSPLDYCVRIADIGGMGLHDFIAAIFAGNLLAVGFVWGIVQFNRHDYKAPWLAYAATLMPLLYFAASLYATEGLPPHLDALAPQ
jgi:hypothetical protein